MKWLRWANKRQLLVHGSIGGVLGIMGSSLVLSLNGHVFLAFFNGFLWGVVWFTAKESTDESVNNHLRNTQLGGNNIWHGWDWKDFAEGTFGSFLGAFVGIAIFNMFGWS